VTIACRREVTWKVQDNTVSQKLVFCIKSKPPREGGGFWIKYRVNYLLGTLENKGEFSGFSQVVTRFDGAHQEGVIVFFSGETVLIVSPGAPAVVASDAHLFEVDIDGGEVAGFYVIDMAVDHFLPVGKPAYRIHR